MYKIKISNWSFSLYICHLNWLFTYHFGLHGYCKLVHCNIYKFLHFLIHLQWWTSTHVKFISTQCASLLCSSFAWASSCCCYRRTGTSVSSSSAPSCANVMSQQRAAERQVPPQGSTGEGEPGPPCQHLHTDATKYYHANTHRERDTFVHHSVDVETFNCHDLPGALPSLSCSFLGGKKNVLDWLWSVTFWPRGATQETQIVYHCSFICRPFHSEVIRVGAWTHTNCNPSYPKNDQV